MSKGPIGLATSGGSGATLAALTSTSGFGVVGNTMLLSMSQNGCFVCAVGATCALSGSTSIDSNGMLAAFKSPAPTYFAWTYSGGTSSQRVTKWYKTDAPVQSSHNWSFDGSYVTSFAAVGNHLYWMLVSGSGTSSVWGTIRAAACRPTAKVRSRAT